jgi:hypothetical protein
METNWWLSWVVTWTDKSHKTKHIRKKNNNNNNKRKITYGNNSMKTRRFGILMTESSGTSMSISKKQYSSDIYFQIYD